MDKFKVKLEENGLSLLKISVSIAGIIFSLFSLGLTIYRGNTGEITHCIFAIVLVCTPAILGIILRFRIRTFMYILISVYALCPLVGEVYNVYHYISVWDDILHFTGGVVFAMFGFYLVKYLNRKNKTSIVLGAVFALCFSIAISAVWEITEFANDQLFGTDMQVDTVVTSINSLYLGDEVGAKISIDNIEEVTVNGTELGIEGYLDIGLIDTMRDMIVETVGALLCVFAIFVDKERHPIFIPIKKTDEN